MIRLAVLLALSPSAVPSSEAARECRAAAARLPSGLMKELTAAMTGDSTSATLSVCSAKAPAIPAAMEACLQWHGDPVAMIPEVETAGAQLYPDDQAVGFKAGGLRGAFSVTRSLP